MLKRLAANAVPYRSPVTLDHAKVRTRNSAGSTTGDGWRPARQAKATRPVMATAKLARTRTDTQPQSGPLTRVRASAPVVTATMAAPSRSGVRLTDVSRESGTNRIA